MLPLILVTLGLAAIGAYAKPTDRKVGSLEVYLSTPTDKVASVSDVRLFATVKNVGDEDLKVVKFGTVLDSERPTRSFVVSKDGKDVPFTGIVVRTCSLFSTISCLPDLLPCWLINIHVDASCRIRFSRTTSSRMTWLTSTLERT